ncbi:cob(I)yrinic acid a,c-diamide adenosyltransferase [Opitutus terrae]|uniref:Corrinoid adenosyltransferase n=1 Tax=Opitutus terrae (strain DSM 11246 / JCM 15787 / PB90-1) TaxID=452637 RepID=B1ZMD6_OPITP|nr:cob(I)yrinic acid a,c-diamide adenosyltransferase [Opitutus terrae]ACB73389.1 ATP--cobalamin adenosyltransferase [Opitutus terrae PB90-1]
MSIATRTGDQGMTGLLYGQRVPKDHPQIEAVGAFDELNAAVGLAKAACPDTDRRAALEAIQHDLIALMGEVACAESDLARYEASKFPKLGETELARIDAAVAAIEARKIRFDGWATPGANTFAGALELARTVARRAERRLVALKSHGRTVRPVVGQYVNRVADLLWLMAREAEK